MLEPVDQQYIMIGRIAQAHGTDGTILMIPEHYAPALFDDIDLVRLQNARGDLVPARVESVRVQEKNNRLSFFVKFDHITDRNQAEGLKDFSVYIDREKAKGLLAEENSDELVSFEVLDENGISIGMVDAIIDNPAHPILIVQTGNQPLLIPRVDEYVSKIDEDNKLIYCRNLDQLENL